MTDAPDESIVPDVVPDVVPEPIPEPEAVHDKIPEWGQHLIDRVDEIATKVKDPEPEPEHHEPDTSPSKPPWTHRKPWQREHRG